MHKIFSYTVPHTGTRFLNNLFREGLDSITFLGDIHPQKRGRGKPHIDNKECQKIDSSWWDKNILSFATKEEKAKNYLLFHAHHRNINSEIIAAARAQEPEIKIISSIRDPLLVINTAMWTKYALEGIHPEEETTDWREERAWHTTILLTNLLSLPQQHIYLFPTDLIQNKSKEDKLLALETLTMFCNITPTTKMKELITAWSPVGATDQARKLKEKERYSDFYKYKRIINSGEVKEIEKIMKIELACLSYRKELKSQMIALGYNPCW
jgi:hypothetical protein